jgi:zinc D-Ala-D-Ala carboxypeptidase
MTFYGHWRDAPASSWRWPHFSPAEIACRGTGKLLANEAALDKLQALRDRVGKPLIIRSAYRSPEHNRAVGGAKASKHLEGIAFDIAMANHDPEVFEAAARAVGFRGFGFYPRSGFIHIHIDLGPARSWGERFPKRATAFAEEPPPAREVLAESRTLKGGGAAGVATIGAAGVEMAQEALAETQRAILPLVPYLDTLRWLFIAVALGGIAVAICARLDDWKAGPAVIAGLIAHLAALRLTRTALRCGLLIAAVLLVLVAARRAGKQTGRLLERLETTEKTNDVQRETLEAASRRPRDRVAACPPIVDYSAELRARAAETCCWRGRHSARC